MPKVRQKSPQTGIGRSTPTHRANEAPFRGHGNTTTNPTRSKPPPTLNGGGFVGSLRPQGTSENEFGPYVKDLTSKWGFWATILLETAKKWIVDLIESRSPSFPSFAPSALHCSLLGEHCLHPEALERCYFTFERSGGLLVGKFGNPHPHPPISTR